MKANLVLALALVLGLVLWWPYLASEPKSSPGQYLWFTLLHWLFYVVLVWILAFLALQLRIPPWARTLVLAVLVSWLGYHYSYATAFPGSSRITSGLGIVNSWLGLALLIKVSWHSRR